MLSGIGTGGGTGMKERGDPSTRGEGEGRGGLLARVPQGQAPQAKPRLSSELMTSQTQLNQRMSHFC